MTKHTILFLAANPLGTARLALDQEAPAIQVELERSGHRDRFELVTRWASQPLDLLRELRKLRPTVVHFSGLGGRDAPRKPQPGNAPRRDIVREPDTLDAEDRHGLYFQGLDGRPQLASTTALEATFGAAGSSVKLIVLNACYSDDQARALVTHVDCVIGAGGSISDDARRSFAIGLYGGLGEAESVAAAYKQGRAAISLEGLRDSDRPQLKVRDGVDANQLILAANPPASTTAVSATADRPPSAVARITRPRISAGGRVVIVENNYGRIIVGDPYPKLIMRAAITGLVAGLVLLLGRYAAPAAIAWFGLVIMWLFKEREPQAVRAARGGLFARSVVGVGVAAAVAVGLSIARTGATDLTAPGARQDAYRHPSPHATPSVKPPTLPEPVNGSDRGKDSPIDTGGRGLKESRTNHDDHDPLPGHGTELRIANLAPSGSPWMEVLDKAASEIKDKTSGRVTLKYFEGGQQGDERDLVRKINLGQLDGAAVTAVGLAMIDESIRVLELPMMFQSAEELDYVADKLWPHFQKKFEDKGFKLTDRGEVGWIYFLSKTTVETISDLQDQKLWLSGDDQLVSGVFKKLGLNGVPLGVPDVDAALTSGKIDTCYGSPVTAVALQWYTKVKYMTSMPMSFAIGATVLSTNAYKKLAPEDAKVLEDITRVNAKKLRKTIRKANDDAKGTMSRKGVTVVPTPIAMIDEFTKASTEMWNELAGKIYSKEELTMVVDARAEYRAKHK